MIPLLIKPSLEALVAACDVFDAENALIENLLRGLFRTYPKNDDLESVYLKVLTLNSLYSTQIHLYSDTVPTMEDVARHIVANADALDTAIDNGDATAVEMISHISVPGKHDRDYFVFATKYCGWSNQAAFPIYDSRVCAYLLSLYHHDDFGDAKRLRGQGCSYADFRELIDKFRKHYDLENRSYKDIDKFLYQAGTSAWNA